VGLFGGTPDRGEVLELQDRVARLEEQVARLTAALAAQPQPPPATSAGDGPGQALPTTTDVYADVYADARALAAEGKKINAIKVVREQGGMSLKAAKDLVESW
jgi:large subunit ribosomal protein L7/L12